MIAFGFGVLRLAPEAFWGLTPRELAAAGRGRAGRAPAMTRRRLAELAGRYPDEES